MTRFSLFAAAGVVGCAALAACGARDGAAGSNVPALAGDRVRAPLTTASATSSSSGIARVVIADQLPPGAVLSARRAVSAVRRTRFLPLSTANITIAVNGGTPVMFAYSPTGPTCTISNAGATRCTFDVPAPAGDDTIAVKAVDAYARVVAEATKTATIAGITVVSVSLSGVPSGVQVVLAKDTEPAGTATAIPVTVKAFDVDDELITGTYSTPIVLTNSDRTGQTSLSTYSVPASTTAVTLTYRGGWANAFIATGPYNGTTFASGVGSHEYRIPSGTPAMASAGTGTIVEGGDGAMWFGERNGVGRVTTAGTFTETAWCSRSAWYSVPTARFGSTAHTTPRPE